MRTGKPRGLRSIWVAVLTVAVGSHRAAALSSVDQFCTGDPCVISSPKDVDPGAMLDFGTRTVILQSTLNLLPLPSGDIGAVTIHAGTFSVTGVDGQITGFSSTLAGGSVEIDAVNDIQINGTNGGGAVRLYGQDAGSLTLKTTSGSVIVSSRMTMYGNGTYASGGLLTINSAAAISLTGQLDFYGGAQGCGGDFELTAGTDVTLTGTLDLSGGGDGGCLDVTANGSLTLGQVDMSGTGLDASGGLSFITVGGAVKLLGAFRGRGADQGSDCGDGADVCINAGEDITVGANVDMRGRGLDCLGGCLSLDGASVYLPSDIMLSGTGSQGSGGELDVYATTLISFTGSVELDGGDGGGGVAFFSSLGTAQILGSMDASGRASTSPGSTQVEFDATALTVGGSINASGGSSSVAGGQITLNACDVSTQSTALLEARGNLGAIDIEASRSAELRGQFTSGSGGNIVRYALAATPPDTAGASFSPPAMLMVDNTIPPCPACAGGAPCSTPTPSPTVAATETFAPTATPSPSPSLAPTQTATLTPTATPTRTPTATLTLTGTPTLTHTPSPPPAATQTPTLTPTATPTRTPTATLTLTGTPTFTPTPTGTPPPTSSATPSATLPRMCVGDCSGNSVVKINDIITCVTIDLGSAELNSCPACSANGGGVGITDLIMAVNNALNGCSG